MLRNNKKKTMYSNNLGRSITLVLILFISINCFAQVELKNKAVANLSLGVTEVSLLKINTGVISLLLNQRDAGMSIETSNADSSARLIISSLISSVPRTLTARISSGAVPQGTYLMLAALIPNSTFVGSWGSLSTPILLDETDRPFVTNIESCYSGTTASDGYPLKFIFGLDTNTSTYGLIRATVGNSVTVTLTLSSD
jgi:hypothetical protein